MKTELEQIKAALRLTIELSEKATPGPWTWDGAKYGVYDDDPLRLYVPECSHLTGGAICMVNDNAENRGMDCAFIAHARTFAPAQARLALTAIEGHELSMKLIDDCNEEHFIQHGARLLENPSRDALETICREWLNGVSLTTRPNTPQTRAEDAKCSHTVASSIFEEASVQIALRDKKQMLVLALAVLKAKLWLLRNSELLLLIFPWFLRKTMGWRI